MQAKLKYWSTLEYYKYNHSLIEKFKEGKNFLLLVYRQRDQS